MTDFHTTKMILLKQKTRSQQPMIPVRNSEASLVAKFHCEKSLLDMCVQCKYKSELFLVLGVCLHVRIMKKLHSSKLMKKTASEMK